MVEKLRLEEGDYNLLIETIQRKEGYIYIWDWDRVLFDRNVCLTPFHLNEKISLNKITPKNKLKLRGLEFREGDIILTGRGKYQQDQIINLLKQKGYNFSMELFRPFSSLIKSVIPFRHNHFYYKFKLKHIKELYKLYNGKIVVIDDNLKLINKFQEHNVIKTHKT